jgi:hypothetical protein
MWNAECGFPLCVRSLTSVRRDVKLVLVALDTLSTKKKFAMM